MENEPPIDEIVGFLHSSAPALLQELKTENPAFSEILRPGRIAGERLARAETATSDDTKELLMRAKAAIAALKMVRRECDLAMPQIQLRLRRSHAFEVVAQALSLIAGASILTTVAKVYQSWEPAVKIGAGLLAISSTVTMLFARASTGAMSGSKEKLFERYKSLLEYQFQAQRLQDEMIIQADLGSRKVDPLIRETNHLCSQMRLLIGMTI